MIGRVVKRFDRLKTMFILGAAILLNAGMAEGQMAGVPFDWEPFQTRVDLGLRVPSDIPEHNGLIFSDEFSSIRDLAKEETSVSDVRSERNLDLYRYRRIRLYLSHVIIDRKDIDIRQPLSNVDDKINKIKSVPSMFFNSQYRDTFESMGRIFEPQVNLGIEF